MPNKRGELVGLDERIYQDANAEQNSNLDADHQDRQPVTLQLCVHRVLAAKGGSRPGAGRPKRSAQLLKLAGVTRADRLRSEPPSVNTQRRKHDIAPEYVNVSALCGELHRMI